MLASCSCWLRDGLFYEPLQRRGTLFLEEPAHPPVHCSFSVCVVIFFDLLHSRQTLPSGFDPNTSTSTAVSTAAERRSAPHGPNAEGTKFRCGLDV